MLGLFSLVRSCINLCTIDGFPFLSDTRHFCLIVLTSPFRRFSFTTNSTPNRSSQSNYCFTPPPCKDRSVYRKFFLRLNSSFYRTNSLTFFSGHHPHVRLPLSSRLVLVHFSETGLSLPIDNFTQFRIHTRHPRHLHPLLY